MGAMPRLCRWYARALVALGFFVWAPSAYG
jgi:hypothetical protein